MDRVIDIDELWRVAARKLRTSPLPPHDLHVEGLRCLASALESEGRYDADALRLLQREIFARILADQSFSRDLALYPGIPDVPVLRPLLVAGFGRTGSTLLHNLLALDANARAPLLWELWTPSPPPRPESYATDPRIEVAQRRLDAFTRADPLILQVHPMQARAPDECHWMMRHSPLTAMFYQVPEYWAWLKQLSGGELGELYSHYRLQVQHLQLFCRREHWLSKASTHLHFMPVLLDVFPDANVIRLHRHPCHAVPSLCSLVAGYRRLFSQRVDHGEIGTTILDMFIDGMRRSMAFAPPPGGRQQIIDIRYDDLVADPAAAVRRIYAQLGYRFSAAFERDLTRVIESERTAMRPRHRYSLEQFGLSRAQVIERSAAYLTWVQPRCGELAYDGRAP
ncbi:MAG TPA: sulfotransferase [Bradyrhizobium sp.]